MMAAVKPFSYLAGETNPPPKSGFRKPDETYGTALQVETSYRPIGSPEPSEQGENPTQRLNPEQRGNEGPYHRDMINVYQPFEAASQSQINLIDHTTNSEYERKEQEAIDSQKQSTAASAHVKTVPTVARKPKYEQVELQVEGTSSSADVPRTSREHFYGGRQHNGQSGPLKEMPSVDDSADVDLLYGRVNRQKEKKTPQDSAPTYEAAAPFSYTDPMKSVPTYEATAPFSYKDPVKSVPTYEATAPFSYTDPVKSAPTYETTAPFSYTDPMKSVTTYEAATPFSYTDPVKSAPIYGERQSPSNDQNKKSEFSDSIDCLSDLHLPSSPTSDSQNLFDNFILVAPLKTEPRKEEVTSNGPTKRLKLQELFDPPPPSMMSPRKVEIHGVTNTESSDFHNVVLDKSKSSKGDNYSRVRGPVSTFDNPDYSMSSSHTEGGSNSKEFPDFPSDSNRSLSASNSTDKKNKAPAARNQRRRCDQRLCIAILITALVTSVVCLGVGFIAGWFGRERRGF